MQGADEEKMFLKLVYGEKIIEIFNIRGVAKLRYFVIQAICPNLYRNYRYNRFRHRQNAKIRELCNTKYTQKNVWLIQP